MGYVSQVSSVWETEAVGSPGPSFLNAAVAYQTPYTPATLKDRVLRHIETQLGRIRTADKNAPRPIDLDLIIFDGQVLETELWKRLYMARPLAQLLPNLSHPITGRTLQSVADGLHDQQSATSHPEIEL